MNKKLLTVLLSNYGSVISIGFFTPIYALYIVKLGGDVADAGLATAIYFLAAGGLMLLFRFFMNNKKNRPKYYIWGNALEGIAALLFILVNTTMQFYLVQLVHALATAMRVPSQRALYAQYQDRGKEGSEWSIMEGGDFIIMGIAAAVGGYVASTMSFQTVFLLIAGVQFITTIFSLRLLKSK